MALTAAIRTLLIGLITGLVAAAAAWLSALGVEITPEDQLKIVLYVVGFVMTVGSGLVAYGINKLGSKYPWVNQIISLGRAKSPAVYIPNNKEEVTATATPPGEVTSVTTTDAEGTTSAAKV